MWKNEFKKSEQFWLLKHKNNEKKLWHFPFSFNHKSVIHMICLYMKIHNFTLKTNTNGMETENHFIVSICMLGLSHYQRCIFWVFIPGVDTLYITVYFASGFSFEKSHGPKMPCTLGKTMGKFRENVVFFPFFLKFVYDFPQCILPNYDKLCWECLKSSLHKFNNFIIGPKMGYNEIMEGNKYKFIYWPSGDAFLHTKYYIFTNPHTKKRMSHALTNVCPNNEKN